MIMKYILFIKIFLLLSYISFLNLNAQIIFNTTGGNTIANEGEVSFTIGQIVFYSSSGQNGSIIQGAQQPYEISVLSSINEIKPIGLYVHVFPNPTRDFLLLKFESEIFNDYSYQLYEITGKIIATERIFNIETKISMNQLAASTYILRILKGKEEIKSFKIVKK